MDSVTGLMWQRTRVSDVTWQTAVDTCRDLVYAGHDDWRLPNPFELYSIVDYGRWEPAYDQEIFPDLPTWILSSFWTSATLVDYPIYAWRIRNNEGLAEYWEITDTSDARCVRSGYRAPATGGGQRFVELEPLPNEPMVLDIITGLVWQNDPLASMDWQQALSYCESLIYCGSVARPGATHFTSTEEAGTQLRHPVKLWIAAKAARMICVAVPGLVKVHFVDLDELVRNGYRYC